FSLLRVCGTSQANFSQLDETNFLHWSMHMKAHPRHKGPIKYITKVLVALSGASSKAVNTKHAETVVELLLRGDRPWKGNRQLQLVKV
ncbi:hypothetical protein VP01_11332g1, partial [Puccinia sorghi]